MNKSLSLKGIPNHLTHCNTLLLHIITVTFSSAPRSQQWPAPSPWINPWTGTMPLTSMQALRSFRETRPRPKLARGEEEESKPSRGGFLESGGDLGGARTNFTYSDNTTFHSLVTPFDIQPFLPQSQFLTTTQIKHPPNQSSPVKLEICQNKTPVSSSTYAESSGGSAHDHEASDFFFSNEDSNSGYLGCIVPDNCLRPPPSGPAGKASNTSSSNAASNDRNSCFMTTTYLEDHPQCSRYAPPLDITNVPTKAYSPVNFPGFDELSNGFWGEQPSWDGNSGDLSALMNNPISMMENVCMDTSHGIDNPPACGLMPQAASSVSYPAYGDAASFGYSLF
uniref:Uncharacterized protein n=1 Tax=Salix viminalis TaxID=40686 RepID=A0A6N2K2N9_SALVM